MRQDFLGFVLFKDNPKRQPRQGFFYHSLVRGCCHSPKITFLCVNPQPFLGNPAFIIFINSLNSHKKSEHTAFLMLNHYIASRKTLSILPSNQCFFVQLRDDTGIFYLLTASCASCKTCRIS